MTTNKGPGFVPSSGRLLVLMQRDDFPTSGVVLANSGGPRDLDHTFKIYEIGDHIAFIVNNAVKISLNSPGTHYVVNECDVLGVFDEE